MAEAVKEWWEKAREITPGVKNGVHLLACGSALMPQPVIDAIVNHIQLEAAIGGYEAAAQQAEPLDAVYDHVARYIGATRHEIALAENATMAWCHAFYALPLAPGTRILTCEAEYAANYVAYLHRAKRDGLKIDVIPSDASGAIDLDALEAMLDDRVGLIAITWVPTNGGLVNPATAVGAIARKHNIPYLLDACQAVGQMRVDVAQLGCDFLSATGRKFLRGPRGIGFLYVRDTWLDKLEPAMIDHFAAPWTARDSYTLRDDARRFETWENAYALRAGLGAAVQYADSIGIERIEARASHLADYCRSLLRTLPRIHVEDIGRQQCGIVSARVDDAEARDIAAKLREFGFSFGTSDPASTRLDSERRNLPNTLRISPHYYNTEEEIADCVQKLADLIE